MLKKFLVISMLLLSLVGPAFAAEYGLDATKNAANTNGEVLPSSIKGETGVAEIVGVVIQSLLGIVGLVFFVLFFYAGFNWMTAQGNSDKIDKAKETITASLIGIILVFGAYAITNFVFTNLR